MVAYKLDCNIVVSKFKIESRYYDHFWTNALGKGSNPFIPVIEGKQMTYAKLNFYL